MASKLNRLPLPLLIVLLLFPVSARATTESSMDHRCEWGGEFDDSGCHRYVADARMELVEGDRDPVVFIPNIRVDDDLHPEYREPATAWGPNGEIYAVYVARSTHYNPEYVLFSRSDDGGLTWDAPILVNDTSPNATMMPAIMVDETGAIDVVWGEMRFAPYNNEILFSRSVDGGATWSASRRVHPEQPNDDYYRPDVARVGDRILVTYYREVSYPDGQPYLVFSEDEGANWSEPVRITTTYCAYGGASPRLAVHPASGIVGVAVETRADQVFFLRSDDGGESWSAPVVVNDASATSVGYPDLACTEDGFHLVFSDNRHGQYDTDIFHSFSADAQVFTANVKVNDAFTGNQYEPHLSPGADGRLHVAWIWNLPFQGNIDLYYSQSDDGGATWLATSPRVNDVPYCVQPYVAWTADILGDAAGNAYLCWNDGRTSGYYDNIYFTRTEDQSGVADEDVRWEAVSLQVTNLGDGVAQLHLSLPRASRHNAVSLHDISGRRLASSSLGRIPAGRSEIPWSIPAAGLRSNGTYFVRLETREGIATAKSIWVR